MGCIRLKFGPKVRFLEAEQEVQAGLWYTEKIAGAADSHRDKLATASELVRPDGGITPRAVEPRGLDEKEDYQTNQENMDNEMLNAVENEERGKEENEKDRNPDRGLLRGGSDGKGLGQEMATEDQRFTDDADHWAAGPSGSGSAGGSGENEGKEAEAEGEEGRQPVALKAPIQVTMAEREEHELTHTPFRAWCAHCVRGRGKHSSLEKTRR